MTGQQDADPITVLQVHQAGYPPGRARFYLTPRSLAARLAADAAKAGSADEVDDLGPGALLLAQAANKKRAEYGHGTMVLVGVAQDDKWVWWIPTAPVEPVPGSPGAIAAKN